MPCNVGEGSLVLLQERGELLEAFFVESVKVRDEFMSKNLCINQLPAIWSDGQVFKTIAVFKFQMLLNHYHIFNSDTKFAIFVVTRLVGDAHAGFKLGSVSL